jgi:hypothetical protein
MLKYLTIIFFLIGCNTSRISNNKAKKGVPIVLKYVINNIPPNADFSDHYYFDPLKRAINTIKPNAEVLGLMAIKKFVSENMDIKATSDEMIRANGDAIKMQAALDKSMRQFNNMVAFAKEVNIKMYNLNEKTDSISMQFCGYPSKTIYPTHNFGFVKIHDEPELEFIMQKLDSCLRVTNFLN